MPVQALQFSIGPLLKGRLWKKSFRNSSPSCTARQKLKGWIGLISSSTLPYALIRCIICDRVVENSPHVSAGVEWRDFVQFTPWQALLSIQASLRELRSPYTAIFCLVSLNISAIQPQQADCLQVIPGAFHWWKNFKYTFSWRGSIHIRHWANSLHLWTNWMMKYSYRKCCYYK